MELISHALVIAIFTIFWEIILRHPTLKVISNFKYKEIRRKIMKFNGNVYISKSIYSLPGERKSAARLSDVEIERGLREDIADEIITDNEPLFDIDNPNINLIVIGSTRYNKHAKELQRKISPQFEYIFDVIEGDPDRHMLRIVNKYGDIYFSSIDLDHYEDDYAIDYGVLLHAKLNNYKRVIWISGIHGAGSIGVYKYFKENPLYFTESFIKHDKISYLFKVKYNHKVKSENLKMIKDVEIISTSDSCDYRKVKKPSVIIFDFGNVIMSFDRNRTYRAIAHRLKRQFQQIKDIFESHSDIREQYENGQLTDIEFYNKIIDILGTTAQDLPFDLFEEFWGDIFWPDNRIIELLKELKNDFKLVLLSNTNNLHFSGIREHFPDFVDLFEGRLILSYEVKMSKPDSEIFYKAIRTINNVATCDCIYIDDKSNYVEVAKQLGMVGIVYNSYAQLVYQLRANGAYNDVVFK